MNASKDAVSILVVDDDPDDVDLLKDVLSEMRGYEVEVTWAASFEQAMRREPDN
ncbi:MAG: hypothetical protein IOD12_14320, partial [Silvanigrellales bacterium]|nr:hypothetical protein [Silvanigrellales bacterium]